ncbi:c-type cytochrome [Comamonas composti]|uniref:c-type cytochrome n=1 Tax=Comamonas composti TaxID=408558 RepID=UPI0003FA2A47|nr:c-type cytochrome [Comamonas composti]
MPQRSTASPVFWLALLLSPFAAHADDAPAGPRLRPLDMAVLAGTCVNCHGPDGRSTAAIPSLRDQSAKHLLERMQAFKSGRAPDATVMTRLMKGYDDAQIRALAQWFAGKEGK